VALILSAATSTKMLRTARIIGSSQTNPGFFRWEDNATEPTLIEPALQSLRLPVSCDSFLRGDTSAEGGIARFC
jgi:hypothetical protein